MGDQGGEEGNGMGEVEEGEMGIGIQNATQQGGGGGPMYARVYPDF